MSEKHTPGRLEVAVEVFDNDGCPETVIQGMDGAASVAVALDFGQNNPEMRYANARRLVACWNACEGISTDALVGGTALITAFQREQDRADKAEAQRDKLLAALKLLTTADTEIAQATDAELEDALESEDKDVRDQANAFLVARAAIQEVEQP